ncbi:ABC transporter ATP-binding protein [Streptomyces argyrophyllae]|uniref:ABC-type quaternary amine transporter n=1 Tax=Streptomyces argyrophylli TaxID=2726118 RepID=A0A6M4PW46_9ACTN|nr:ABC transporter ATP-binding protein [Streptomyces argyrophyllae]QJS13956.1 ABC transporter ATP-binding protein [Streptomyces argyrophyllae]
MPELAVENISKSFSGNTVLTDVEFTVAEGEFFTLLGPSGCGKSTTLACVAGLEDPDSGTIRVGDNVFFDGRRDTTVPPEGRNLGLVFQSYALWPHMTVADNLAFPLKLRKLPADERDRRVDAALDKVGLLELRDRYPHQLSGGQQQRVALARGIVYSPGVLLLDEPLSNLDAKMRDQARAWLKDLQRDMGITTVYVTHDQVEAMSLSDRIAVFLGGRLEQVGTPAEIYETPATPEVAAFIGRCNLLDGTVHMTADDTTTVRVSLSGTDQSLRVPRTDGLHDGQSVTVGLRAERVRFTDETVVDEDQGSVLKASIVDRAYTGAHYEYRLSVGDLTLLAESPTHRAAADTTVQLRADDCLVYPHG